MKKNIVAVVVLAAFTITAFMFFMWNSNNSSYDEKFSVIRVGVLPDQSEAALQKRYQPLLDNLSEDLGIEFRLVLCKDYNDLVQKMANDEIELASFGGLTYLQAQEALGVAAVVTRDVDLKFTSYFITHNMSDGQTLSDFLGMPFSYGSSSSTSGHLMPRYFMRAEFGKDPLSLFSDIHYSGAHDKTVYWVLAERNRLGVVNAEILQGMLNDGRLKKEDIRIIWETPPYADYIWAASNRLTINLRNEIQDSFLSLELKNPSDRAILSQLGANYYLPVYDRDYENLRDIATSLNMIRGSQ